MSKPLEIDDGKKRRHYAISTYIGKDNVDNYVQNNKKLFNYAYIVHDKDNNEPHIHLIVSYKNPRTLTGVRRDFANYEQNTFVETVKNIGGVYDYLTHKNHPDRYQYNEEDIVTAHGYRSGSNNPNIEQDVAVLIVMDILDGLCRRELLLRYGREYAINRRHYESLACDIQYEESDYNYTEGDCKCPEQPKPRTLIVDYDDSNKNPFNK